MPQLDKVTFLSQFFWLCLFYLGFYYIVLKYFLPKISRILTLRKKKMNLSQYGSNSLQQENQQIRENLDNNLSRGLSLSRNVFNDLLSGTNRWLDESLTGVNKTHYKPVNNSYIKSLGEASLSQNIWLYHASSNSPENLKVNVLVDKIRNLRKTAFQLQAIGTSISKRNLQQQDQTIISKNTSTVQENNKKSKKNKKDTK